MLIFGKAVQPVQWIGLDFSGIIHPAPPSKIKDPFVVGAIISTGHCLDLTEAASLNILKAAYHDYAMMWKGLSLPLPDNQSGYKGDADLVKRYLDCAVLNFLHDLREDVGEPPFDTIRCPFFEGDALFPGAKIAARTHLQWCVRDPRKSVIGYFRVRDIPALLSGK